MRALLVDDELPCLEILSWSLEIHCPEVQVIGTCTQPVDAMEKINALKPDLVFLDVEMPGMNAFELLSHFKPLPFEVIFITAYDHFALQAFRENAVAYLLKPIDQHELSAAVRRVGEKKNKTAALKIDTLLSLFREQMSSGKKIALPTGDGMSFVTVDTIVRCESDSNYTFVFLTDGQRIVITKTLKQIEDALSMYPFYRVHQSHLVNLNHIVKFNRDSGGYLVMSDKKTITVARQRKEGLLELFARL